MCGYISTWRPRVNTGYLSLITPLSHLRCIFYVYSCFACKYLSVPCACSSCEGQRGAVDPLRLEVYRWLWAFMWVLGTESESWAVSPAPHSLLRQALFLNLSTLVQLDWSPMAPEHEDSRCVQLYPDVYMETETPNSSIHAFKTSTSPTPPAPSSGPFFQGNI